MLFEGVIDEYEFLAGGFEDAIRFVFPWV